MGIITIETKEREKTISLIKDALGLEKKIIEQSITKTKGNIDRLLTTLKIDLKTFLKGNIEHSDENDMLLLELEGEVAFLQRLQDKLASLDELKICP